MDNSQPIPFPQSSEIPSQSPSPLSSPSPQPPKSPLFIIIGGITLLLLGLTGGTFLSKNFSSSRISLPVSPTLPLSPSSYLSPINPSSPSPTSDPTANWKIYTTKDGLLKISYPPNWTVNDTNGIDFGSNNMIQISILIHKRGDKEYIENLWKSVNCSGDNESSGCAADQNKEITSFTLNNNTVFWKITGNGQMYVYIPNETQNKTIEIYTLGLTDRKLFDQILSTFKFLGTDSVMNYCNNLFLGGPFTRINDCRNFKVLVRPCCDQLDVIIDKNGNKLAECGGITGYSDECRRRFLPQTQCSSIQCNQ